MNWLFDNLPKFAGGYNPMRWVCQMQGCYNLKKRPKIEVFADCFPGLINFGDVDALVELNGHYLLLEWKPSPVELSTGQALVYERLPDRFSAILVAGDAETMEVTHMAWARNGRIEPWVTSNLHELQYLIFQWAALYRSPWHRWTPTRLFNQMVARWRALAVSVGA